MSEIQDVHAIALASVVAGAGVVDLIKRVPAALGSLRHGACIGKASLAGAAVGSVTTGSEVLVTGQSKYSPTIAPWTGSFAALAVDRMCRP